MPNTSQSWEQYRQEELARVSPHIATLGYTLEDNQPHLKGERFLMQAVTTESGRKLILLARRKSDGKRAVIKATSDPAGARELRRERECRRVLREINFAYKIFFSPEELHFSEQDGCTISIQEFIEQERPFLERPTEEQFSFALNAFKAQESAHATTYRHLKLITKTFGVMDAEHYLELFRRMSRSEKALALLETNRETIEQYCGFLTHTDFVPHNFRIKDGRLYLLDHSSLRFGNKYEGWARFLNFMTLYHPELERALVAYVRDNRTPEESLSLELMRIYRLGEIIHYYERALEQSSGDLSALNRARVEFWSEVLHAALEREPVPRGVIEEYKKTRDLLRSEEEKERQRGLH